MKKQSSTSGKVQTTSQVKLQNDKLNKAGLDRLTKKHYLVSKTTSIDDFGVEIRCLDYFQILFNVMGFLYHMNKKNFRKQTTNMFGGIFVFICQVGSRKEKIEVQLDNEFIGVLEELQNFHEDLKFLKHYSQKNPSESNAQRDHHSEPVFFLKVLENIDNIAEKLKRKLQVHKELNRFRSDKNVTVLRCIFVGASSPNTVCTECQHCVIGFQIIFSHLFKNSKMFNTSKSFNISEKFKLISFIAGIKPYNSREMKEIDKTSLERVDAGKISLGNRRFIQTLFTEQIDIDALKISTVDCLNTFTISGVPKDRFMISNETVTMKEKAKQISKFSFLIEFVDLDLKLDREEIEFKNKMLEENPKLYSCLVDDKVDLDSITDESQFYYTQLDHPNFEQLHSYFGVDERSLEAIDFVTEENLRIFEKFSDIIGEVIDIKEEFDLIGEWKCLCDDTGKLFKKYDESEEVKRISYIISKVHKKVGDFGSSTEENSDEDGAEHFDGYSKGEYSDEYLNDSFEDEDGNEAHFDDSDEDLNVRFENFTI